MEYWLITEDPPYDHWKKGLNYLDVVDTINKYGPEIVKVPIPENRILRHEKYNEFFKVYISDKWVNVWNASRINPSSKHYDISRVYLRLLNKLPHYEETHKIPPTSLP